MKQTAVEWLFDNLDLSGGSEAIKTLNKAKAMEKEQIIEAWNTRSKIDGVLTFTDNRTAEQYYTETYESKINF